MRPRGRFDSEAPRIPEGIAERCRTALEAAAAQWQAEMGPRLISLVLSGSVASGGASPDSGIDVLAAAEGLPRSFRDRRRPLLDLWERVRAERGLPFVDWNRITKSPEEAAVQSPLYLDLVEDAVIRLDRGNLIGNLLAAMRERMRPLGSRKAVLPGGSSSRDLKPDDRRGDAVEI